MGLIIKESRESVADTVESLLRTLSAKGINVFAQVDHAAAAKKAGMELKDEHLLIFGDPKVGTFLMQENPAIGIELPLKILVWKDKNGVTKVAYKDPKAFSQEYGIEKNKEILDKMCAGLAQLIEKAVIQEVS